jgi:hypothetical protein
MTGHDALTRRSVIVTVTATGELDITTAPGLMEAY